MALAYVHYVVYVVYVVIRIYHSQQCADNFHKETTFSDHWNKNISIICCVHTINWEPQKAPYERIKPTGNRQTNRDD